jgi:SAM-dependent methyltransferase
VAKRTGKTHENLEKELAAAPAPHPAPGNDTGDPARVRAPAEGAGRSRHARGERSSPIGISGGDFATPTSRKRTITQPRGLPVIGAAVKPRNGTPQPISGIEGALPDAPFAVPASSDLSDAASRLAAEAAAARALDSGPLTPPPTLDDPGPTPPPVLPAAEPAKLSGSDAPTPEPVAATPAPVSLRTPPPAPVFDTSDEAAGPSAAAFDGESSEEAESSEAAESPEATESSEAAESPGATESSEAAESPEAAESVESPMTAAEPEHATVEENFAAHETPWPELGAHNAVARAITPTPGAIPTDAMGGDSGAGINELSPEREDADEALASRHQDEGEVAGGDDLEVVEGADGTDHLDALPAEALVDGGASAPSERRPAPPISRPSAPPPIPMGSPKRKTGENRAPEVPAAQVVASIVSDGPADAPNLPEALAQRPRRSKRSKPWFEEVFDEDYLRTLPFMSADQTLREVEFIESALEVRPGGRVLDIGCGYGRHAIELVQRGLDVTGLDLSLPLLIRAADEAQKRAMSVNFVHADMREMAFEQQFDGAYAMLTSFGYFDEEANLRVAEGIARALKPGARFLLDLVNRDYIVGDLPSRIWWEGNGCVVLEEVDFNFHTSRIMTHRSIVFEDGRQLEQEISVRAYSLHEIGRLLRQAGFRVLDISGSLATRGHFFGSTSRNLLILAEKRAQDT